MVEGHRIPNGGKRDPHLGRCVLGGRGAHPRLQLRHPGQFQRLLVAFALVGDPNVLMLDEPAAGVDAPGQERLAETIERLREQDGVTVMVMDRCCVPPPPLAVSS